MALQPRKIGESKAQYDRRVGKRPPTRIGRPQTGRLRLPPTKATPKPVTKPKAVTVTGKRPPTPKPKRTHGDPITKRRVPKKDITKGKPIATIDYFDKDGKRVIVRQDDPPTRRTPRPKRPTVDPRRQRRKPLTPEQRANLSNLMEQQRRKVNQFNRSRRPQLPAPVGSRQKPISPEQRKKLQEAMISQREILQRAMKSFLKRGKPKTTKGVAIPLKQAPKKPTGRGRRFTTTARTPSTAKKRAR